MRTIADLRSDPSLATNTLRLDLSITSIHALSKAVVSIKKPIDGSELFSTQTLDSISDVHRNQKQEMSRVLGSEETDVMNWLCTLDFRSKHKDALSRRHECTSRWLPDCSEFRPWLDTAGKAIWCPWIR